MATGKKNKNNTRNPQSLLFRRLTRLLSGPLTQYRTQNNHRLRRIELDKYANKFTSASGKDFKKTAYNPYDNLQASYMAGQHRTERYVDFDQMEYTPEIASSLDIYADEMTTYSSINPMLNVECDNQEIKALLESLYQNVLNVEHNLFSWCRTMCKYGDFFLYLDVDDSLGVTSVIGLPTQEVERMEGEDKSNPNYVQFQWNSAGLTFENWQVGHFRILGQDKYNPYGTSVLEAARRIWRQLTLLEDAMMAYRIVRSPERRAFYIDVGNIPPQDVEQYMQKVMTSMKRNQVVDPNTGRVDLRYNPLSIEEDYFIPVRGNSATKIEPVAGGKYTGDIDDVKYLRDKLFSALKIPSAYISSDGDKAVEDKTTLAQKDVRFARTIQRLQRSIITELEKIGVIHLYTLGYREEDLVSFTCHLNNPSKIAEMQELEHWKTKFEIVGAATEGFFSKQWLAKTLFGMSNEDFIRNRREMFYDKRFEAALETVAEAEQAEMTAGLDAGIDDLDAAPGSDVPGGTGTVGDEPELGAPPDDAAMNTSDASSAAEPEDEGGLLATPPGRRDDRVEVEKGGKKYTTTAKSKGKLHQPKAFDGRPAGKRRQHLKQKKEFGTTRSTLPGMSDLKGLINMSSIYEENATNYKKEESKILKEQKELKALFESLKARDKKNETETQ
jgi:hypothetical protein